MPTVGKIGSAEIRSWRPVGENRQRRFVDEHGLDAGLSRPGRKIRRGDALTKQGLFRHSRQCWNRQRGRTRGCSDKSATSEKSAARICAAGGPISWLPATSHSILCPINITPDALFAILEEEISSSPRRPGAITRRRRSNHCPIGYNC